MSPKPQIRTLKKKPKAVAETNTPSVNTETENKSQKPSKKGTENKSEKPSGKQVEKPLKLNKES